MFSRYIWEGMPVIVRIQHVTTAFVNKNRSNDKIYYSVHTSIVFVQLLTSNINYTLRFLFVKSSKFQCCIRCF